MHVCACAFVVYAESVYPHAAVVRTAARRWPPAHSSINLRRIYFKSSCLLGVQRTPLVSGSHVTYSHGGVRYVLVCLCMCAREGCERGVSVGYE